MSEIDTLEASLKRSPSDRSLWLVYADILLDRGDIRGRLVKLGDEIEHAALSEEERAARVDEIRKIEEDHRDEWLRGLSFPKGSRLRWQHGFLTEIVPGPGDRGMYESGPAEGWLDQLSALAAHPTGRLWRRLDLFGRLVSDSGLNIINPEGAVHLAACAWLSGLTELELRRNDIGPEGTQALAASPYLGSIRKLGLGGNFIRDEGAAALAESSALPSLVELDLSFNSIGASGVVALMRGRLVRGLRVLDLSSNYDIDDTVIEALASSGGLEKLEKLSLAENHIGPTHIAALGALPALTELSLSETGVGDEGLAAVASADGFEKLETLALSYAKLGPASAATLARGRSLRGLRKLDLSRNYELDDSVIAALVAGPLRGLRSIDLCSTALTDEGFLALARSDLPLESLSISGEQITGPTLASLLASPVGRGLSSLKITYLSDPLPEGWLPAERSRPLRELTLQGCYLGPNDVDPIVRSGALRSLVSLDLSENALEDSTAVAIADAGLTELRTLDLSGNTIGAIGVAALASSRALGRLEKLSLAVNKLEDDSAAALASSTALASLVSLDLKSNEIGPEGATILARSPLRLRALALGGNPIDSEGALAFVRSQALRDLEDLDLSKSRLSYDVADILARSAKLRAYVSLDDRYFDSGE